VTDAIPTHYHRDGILAALRAALAQMGRTPSGITPEDLAGFDQIHLRGLAATTELLQLAGVTRGERVLDLGGGVGGSARVAASRTGCRVTVVDITPTFCEVGAEITRWARLDDHVRVLLGDATAPPVPDAGFDVVWTQHASMNIPDKAALYQAAARALAPGGRFVLHDVMGGDRWDALHYPVPWASHAGLSALMHVEEQRRLIQRSGFTERAWHDVTESTRSWLAERIASPSRSPIGQQILLGDAVGTALANVLRNIEEDRIRVIMAGFD